jgi:hypothetical protein
MQTILTAVVLLFACALLATQQQGPGLAPPKDGVQYSVERREKIYKPAPVECGYNDSGAMNMRHFNRETRQYTEYKGGMPVKVWYEKVDVFVSCHES